MNPTGKVNLLIQRAIEGAAGRMEDLASEVGVTYHSLRAWADGRRNPTPENVQRLASALRARGGRLLELAEELEREAGE